MIENATKHLLLAPDLLIPSPEPERNGSRNLAGARTPATPPARAPAKTTVGGCLHSLFEAQAEATPDADALVWGTKRLTYGTLNARANRIADVLSSLGVGAETVVGIFLERSPDLVSAIMGDT